MCQEFNHFSDILHHFVLPKLAASSIRVKMFKCLFHGVGSIQFISTQDYTCTIAFAIYDFPLVMS